MRGGDEASVRAESEGRLGDRGQAELDASFAEFCQRNFGRVERFLLGQCADRGLVEDAVQEAFLATRVEWAQIRTHQKPLAWVYKTARYKLLLARRRGFAEDAPGLDEPALGTAGVPDTGTEPTPRHSELAEVGGTRVGRHSGAAEVGGTRVGRHAGRSARSEGDPDAATARELLGGWLRQLPPHQAEVFSLALDGWSDQEIAGALGIAYRTARSYRQEAGRRIEDLAGRAGFAPGVRRGRE